MQTKDVLIKPVKTQEIKRLDLSGILDLVNNTSSLKEYMRISLLSGCNMDCFYCHNEGNFERDQKEEANKSQKINKNLMWRAIEASIKLGKKKFKFTGGEPTLDPEIVSIIERLKNNYLDIDVGIITNGSKLSNIAEPLYNTGLDSITISLDTLNSETHKIITRRNNHQEIIEGIEKTALLPFKKKSINTVVTKYNLNEVDNIVQYATKRGFSIKILDALVCDSTIQNFRTPHDELVKRFGNQIVKGKPYLPKCIKCDYTEICGEKPYLRLNADNTLSPCLYREDLKITLEHLDDEMLILKKVALGFRRVKTDTL
jgi:molybdenum cofactor biosynthesis enzyme MoaA